MSDSDYLEHSETPYADIAASADSMWMLTDERERREAIFGALWLLRDRLVWRERRYEDSGQWHVTVTMEGVPVFGNDGHLLSEDVNEGRFLAFVSLLHCVADPDMNRDLDVDPSGVPDET